MSEILLVNPRRRRKKGRRKMSALQRKYFGGGRKSRKANPKRRKRRRSRARVSRRRRRSNPIAVLAPRRKRRRKGRARARRSSRRRRNPVAVAGMSLSRFKPSNVQATLMNAFPGAVGALGLDVLLGYVPVPPAWKVGYLGYVTKAAGAIVLGMLASKVVKGSTAAKMTEGALTVMFHGILRNAMGQFAPNIPMGVYLSNYGETQGMGYYGSGWNPDREFGDGMNAYLPDISSEQITTDDRDLGMYVGDDYG